jgi:hypothetical protein
MPSKMDDQAWVEQNDWGGSNRDGGRTIGEACVEVKPDSPVEQLVGQGRMDEEMHFCVGHQKEGEEGRGRRRVIE